MLGIASSCPRIYRRGFAGVLKRATPRPPVGRSLAMQDRVSTGRWSTTKRGARRVGFRTRVSGQFFLLASTAGRALAQRHSRDHRPGIQQS